jgi:hypothetical protein
MTPNDVLQLQTFLLITINACGDVGIQAESIIPRARMEQFRDLTAPQLRVELLAMSDRGWVVAYQPALGAQRWKITGLGRAALQEAGLA